MSARIGQAAALAGCQVAVVSAKICQCLAAANADCQVSAKVGQAAALAGCQEVPAGVGHLAVGAFGAGCQVQLVPGHCQVHVLPASVGLLTAMLVLAGCAAAERFAQALQRHIPWMPHMQVPLVQVALPLVLKLAG